MFGHIVSTYIAMINSSSLEVGGGCVGVRRGSKCISMVGGVCLCLYLVIVNCSCRNNLQVEVDGSFERFPSTGGSLRHQDPDLNSNCLLECMLNNT